MYSEAEQHGREGSRGEPIAIVGVGCRFPRAEGPDAFWRMLREGVEGVGEIPRERWNVDDFYDADAQAPGKMNTRRAAMLSRVDEFDARFFGISPREAVRLDPQQRILLEVAWEALEDAGQVPEHLAGSRSGVFVGVMSNEYSLHLMGDPREVDPYTVPGMAYCIAANRLSYFFGFTGPSMAVDTACSSSLVAVRLACQSLRSGETDLALAGGVNVILAPEGSVWFTKVGLSSPDGRCKVFDASANGLVRGEGAGVVVLKTLSRARADGDSIYAVIRGGAVNQGGRTNGLMAPSRWAQEAVLREAYRDAGVSPADIHYVETHSTGTSFGDPIEASALGTVRAESPTPAAGPCVIGSVKTNIGHLEAASGIAGLIKVALMLKRREIPANLHFKEPNPHLNLEQLGLRVPVSLGRWPEGSTPLRAGVSAFGFGGTNAHIVVEEAPAEESREELSDESRAYFLPISARGPEALRAHAQAHREMLARDDATRADALRDICYTAGARRAHHDYRLGLTGGTREELVEGLDAFLRGESRPGVSTGRKISSRRVKIVFAFADELGEGSEGVRELSEQEPAFAEALARCDAAFRDTSAQSVLEELGASSASSAGEARAMTPRALFSLQVALAALWRAWGVEPDSVLGVGVGELAASHVAGTSSLEDAARAVSQMNRLDVRPLPESALEALTKERNLAFLLMGGRAEFGERVAEFFQSRERPATVLPSLRGAEAGRASMLDSLAALYCAGSRVNWHGLYADGGRLVRLPSYPWQRERFWIDRIWPAPFGTRDEEATRHNGASPAPTQNGETRDASEPDWRVRVRALKADERQAFTEEFLREEAAKVLGLAPERLDAQTPLNALGIDSLMAMELRNRVEKSTGIVLPVVNLLRGPSISEVATYLLENLTGDAVAVSAREPEGRAESSHAESAHGANGHAGSLYPLSHNQRSLWFMQQLAPESPAYNLMMAWRVRSEIDAAAMRRASQKVIDRHASLRTTYTAGADEAPFQHVHAELPVSFETADVSGVGEAELSALVADRAHRPFDLERGPLLRFELFTRSAREHVLLLSVHHIVVDFGSVAILMDELLKLYREEAGGAAAVLDSPGASYTDYVRWQNELLAGPEGERLREYWQQRLSGKLPLLEVPTDKPRRPTRSPRGDMHTFKLDEDLTARLKALAKEEGVTLYTLLLAAYQMLLQRRSGQRELIVGSPASGRSRADFEKTVGYFANPILFRADFNGNPTFRNFLGQVRQTVLGALAHQDYPFPLLVEALQVARDPSRSPLCEAVFILQRPRRAGASGAESMSPLEVFLLARPGLGFEVEGLTLEHFEFEQRVARFDLVLFLIETSGLLSGLLQYNKDLFERATAERLCAGFETLLRGIVARPEARLNTFETRSQTNVEERRSPEIQGAKESKLGRLKGARRRAVDLSEVSVVTAEPLREGEPLPLVLRPAAEHVDPFAWARDNRDFVESHLLRHGAILFRGFNLSAASEFERLAESLSGDLFNEYADLPREEVSGKVYGSTPYPADQAILFHNESSHMHCWPLKIWFFCETAAETGGETPVADCRRIYREMSAELREPFERKGLMYVRNFVEGFDVRWQDFFRTDDRAAVEAECRRMGMEAEWLGGGQLRVRKLSTAVADHPKTGERVFFNQIQAHHVSCLDAGVRRSMLSLFGEENMPRNVFYGDGSIIEDEVVDAVREVYDSAAVAFPWREGDVMMLDNMLTAHGRNPYTGRRKIFVTMGEMIPGQALQQ